MTRRPGTVLATIAACGGVGLFSWNALVKQPVPHPAPLFASAKPASPPVEPPRRPDFQAASTPTPPAKPAAEASTRLAANDAIGALIRSGEPASAAPRPAEAKPSNSPRVATAQKALGKLGYGPIEADGVFGAATRQALEKFEKDKKLPVTGSLGPKTSKQLASASGLPID